MKTYIVTCAAKFPTALSHPSKVEISANNKRDAIKQAKRNAERNGYWADRFDPDVWTACEA